MMMAAILGRRSKGQPCNSYWEIFVLSVFHVVVVYKVDRLTRSLGDFAQLIELFDQCGVAFASVTQQFSNDHLHGRLVLNVLLSFGPI